MEGHFKGIYQRGANRHQVFWVPFSGHSELNSMISKYCSLYAQAYMHGVRVLKRLTDEELVSMIAAFDLAMAKIDADTQRALMEEAAKRYLHSMDMRYEHAKNESDWKNVRGEIDVMDVRIQALDADWAALETQKLELEQAKREISNQMLELQYRGKEEQLRQSQAEQDVRKAKGDIEQADVNIRRKELDIDEAEIEESVQGSRLRIKEAQLLSKQAETQRAIAEGERVNAQLADEHTSQMRVAHDIVSADADKTDYELRIENEGLSQKDVDNQLGKATGRLQDTELDKERSGLQVEQSKLKVVETEHEMDRLNRVRREELGQRKQEATLKRDSVGYDKADLDHRIMQVEQDEKKVDLNISALDVDETRKNTGITLTQQDINRHQNYDAKRVDLRKLSNQHGAGEEGSRSLAADRDIRKINEVDIPNVELDKKEAQVRIIEADARLTEIQSEIVRIATQMARLGVSVEEEKSRVLQLDLDIARLDFIEQKADGEKEIYEAESQAIKDNEEYRKEEYDIRKEIADKELAQRTGEDSQVTKIYDRRTETEKQRGALERLRIGLDTDRSVHVKDQSGARKEASKLVSDSVYTSIIEENNARIANLRATATAEEGYVKEIKRMLKELEQLEINTQVTHLIGKIG